MNVVSDSTPELKNKQPEIDYWDAMESETNVVVMQEKKKKPKE